MTPRCSLRLDSTSLASSERPTDWKKLLAYEISLLIACLSSPYGKLVDYIKIKINFWFRLGYTGREVERCLPLLFNSAFLSRDQRQMKYDILSNIHVEHDAVLDDRDSDVGVDSSNQSVSAPHSSHSCMLLFHMWPQNRIDGRARWELARSSVRRNFNIIRFIIQRLHFKINYQEYAIMELSFALIANLEKHIFLAREVLSLDKTGVRKIHLWVCRAQRGGGA